MQGNDGTTPLVFAAYHGNTPLIQVWNHSYSNRYVTAGTILLFCAVQRLSAAEFKKVLARGSGTASHRES